MTAGYRVDAIKLGQWDWAPGFEMFWMEPNAPDERLEPPLERVGVCLENVTENRPLGINESMDETLIAYDRIRREADVLIPLYDPRVFDRDPDGQVA